MLYELEVAGPPSVVELSENDGGTWLLWLHSIGCHSDVCYIGDKSCGVLYGTQDGRLGLVKIHK